MPLPTRTLGFWILLIASSLPLDQAVAREKLALRHVALDLPGPPSSVIPADLDGDGRDDLLIVVAYSEIEEIGEDRIENMVQISTVIPAVFERREARAYVVDEEGVYRLAASPLELPLSLLHMEAGPPGLPVIALTDEGLSRLELRGGPGEPAQLELVSLIQRPTVLRGTRAFHSSLRLVHDLDGDGRGDVLFPGVEGVSVYLFGDDGLSSEPSQTLELPGERSRVGRSSNRWYPFPTVRDVDHDGYPDLIVVEPAGEGRVHLLLGEGDGRFGAIRQSPVDCHDEGTDLRMGGTDAGDWPWPQNLAKLRDLDGDGRVEAVFVTSRPRGGKDGLRKELKEAKRPLQLYSFHELRDDRSIEPEPYFELDVIGHTTDEEMGVIAIEEFQDLDGDGREDLVTVTLDFSILQAIKVLVTKKVSIGLDFHVWCQDRDGRFNEVSALDLSEKLKLDLNDLKIGRFAQFAGDFDGDGRQDFTHFGRGRTVTLHRGQPQCRYAKKPDLSIELEQEPASLDLVSVDDLDGDGRSDIRITRPLRAIDADSTAPVRLDLYLSRGAS